jgi:hypothetical protein
MPAFNEEEQIAPLVLQAQQHVDKVVVVDDGGKASWQRTGELLCTENLIVQLLCNYCAIPQAQLFCKVLLITLFFKRKGF